MRRNPKSSPAQLSLKVKRGSNEFACVGPKKLVAEKYDEFLKNTQEELEHKRWQREAERQARDKNYMRCDQVNLFIREYSNLVWKAINRKQTILKHFSEQPAIVALSPNERFKMVQALNAAHIAHVKDVREQVGRGLAGLKEPPQ